MRFDSTIHFERTWLPLVVQVDAEDLLYALLPKL